MMIQPTNYEEEVAAYRAGKLAGQPAFDAPKVRITPLTPEEPLMSTPDEPFRACRVDDVKKAVQPVSIAGCQQACGVTIAHSPSHVVFVLRDYDNEPFAFCAFEPKALEAMLELDTLWSTRND